VKETSKDNLNVLSMDAKIEEKALKTIA